MGNITRRNLIINLFGTIFFSISRFVYSNINNKEIYIVDIRFWPSSDYTRLTLESNLHFKYNYFYLNDPLQLVIDLEDVKLNNIINNLPNKIINNNFIDKVKIRSFNNKLRIVFYLKIKVNLQVFTLMPIANYKDRFVVDFYPENSSDSSDPLMALLDDYSTTNNKIDNNEQIQKNNNDILDKKIQEILSKKNKFEDKDLYVGLEDKHTNKRKINKRKVIIVIDPGHGGEDTGAIGRFGLKEKNVVLSISRLLKKKLTSKGYKVYMTRNDDIFVPLKVRVAKSRKLQGDVFVSIHADAFTNRNVRGSGVFALSYKGATSNSARYLAKTQNSSDMIGGTIGGVKKTDSSIYSTLFDLTQTATINNSLLLGKIILSELNKVNKLHKNYVDQAGFVVLTAPDIPSVLIETAFISNITEEKLLSTNRFREKVATAITNGLVSYITKNV